MTVTVLLSGGLGNQMFQFAAAKALAQRIGTELVIDLRFLTHITEPSKKFRLEEFAISDRFRKYRRGLFESPHGWPRRFWRRIIDERRRIYVEPSLGYHTAFELLSDGVVLTGNFQSPLYFEKFDKLIMGCLRPVCGNVLLEWERIETEQYINVHVRRGDYIFHPGFSLANPLAYYARALNAARERHPDTCVRVFSDDIDWCASQELFKRATFVRADAKVSPLVDMARMANAKGLIIANSSYSWWAGYIAARRGCDVYAPSKWIGNLDVNDIKIYPKQFNVIQAV